MIIPKFNSGDYITNRASGEIAIVDKVTPKNYYKFKYYAQNPSEGLYDLKNMKYELQVNYQKFWDLCNDEEVNKMNEIIKKH